MYWSLFDSDKLISDGVTKCQCEHVLNLFNVEQMEGMTSHCSPFGGLEFDTVDYSREWIIQNANLAPG